MGTLKAYKLSQTQEIKILRSIVGMVGSALALEYVLNDIVEIIVEATRADSVFIYLTSDTKKTLRLMASKIPHDAEVGHLFLRMGEGLTGWVAKENKLLAISAKAYEDARFKEFDTLPEDRYEAFLSQPIIHKDEPIGIINIQHRDTFKHPKNMKDLITAIAGLVGGIISNARLYDENYTKAKRFDSLVQVSKTITSEKYLDEILNLIVVVTAEMLNSKICSIMLIDDAGKNLVIKATQSLNRNYRDKPPLPLHNSLSGDVLREKKPRAVYDVIKEERFLHRDFAIKEKLSSALLIPMVIKDKVVGIINVYTKTFHEFMSEEMNALQIVAHQAAVAIENTKLMEDALNARKALETRKLVDRAKGLLMKQYKLTEDIAYRMIHKKSMDMSKPMKEVAEAIILMADMGAE